jgi:hypothetical protein
MEQAIQIKGVSLQDFKEIKSSQARIERLLEEQKFKNGTPERSFKGEEILTKAEYLSRVNKGTTWFSKRKSKVRHFSHADGSVWVFKSEVEKYFEGKL